MALERNGENLGAVNQLLVGHGLFLIAEIVVCGILVSSASSSGYMLAFPDDMHRFSYQYGSCPSGSAKVLHLKSFGPIQTDDGVGTRKSIRR